MTLVLVGYASTQISFDQGASFIPQFTRLKNAFGRKVVLLVGVT